MTCDTTTIEERCAKELETLNRLLPKMDKRGEWSALLYMRDRLEYILTGEEQQG